MRYSQFAGRLFGAFIAAVVMLPAQSHAQQSDPAVLDYPQTMLKGFVTAEFHRDATGCRNVCEQRSGCVGFDHSTTNICRTFAAVASGQANPSFSAGTRSRIPGYDREPSNLPTRELTPPVEQEIWHFAKFSNVDFYGGDIIPKGIEVGNLEICKQACDSDRLCNSFTFNAEQNRCFLKNGHEFVQGASGVTSGIYFKAKPSEARLQLNAEWDLFLMSDLPGHDIGEYRANSYQQCMAQCEELAFCGGFTWVYSGTDHCYLKSGPGLRPVRARKGMVSASKSTRTVYPDFIETTASRD